MNGRGIGDQCGGGNGDHQLVRTQAACSKAADPRKISRDRKPGRLIGVRPLSGFALQGVSGRAIGRPGRSCDGPMQPHKLLSEIPLNTQHKPTRKASGFPGMIPETPTATG